MPDFHIVVLLLTTRFEYFFHLWRKRDFHGLLSEPPAFCSLNKRNSSSQECLFHNTTADILLLQRVDQVFNRTIHQLGFLLWTVWAKAIWLQIPGNKHEPDIFSSLSNTFLFKLLLMTNSNIYFSESWLLKLHKQNRKGALNVQNHNKHQERFVLEIKTKKKAHIWPTMYIFYIKHTCRSLRLSCQFLPLKACP